jgi:hypothetical protein
MKAEVLERSSKKSLLTSLDLIENVRYFWRPPADGSAPAGGGGAADGAWSDAAAAAAARGGGG